MRPSERPFCPLALRESLPARRQGPIVPERSVDDRSANGSEPSVVVLMTVRRKGGRQFSTRDDHVPRLARVNSVREVRQMPLTEHIHNKVHSALYFDDQRDHWWNRDFLELMGQRLRFDNVHKLLDVGCGMGHWGRALAQALPPDAQVIGIDREPIWIEEARAHTRAAGGADRFDFQVGRADALAFDDDSFDLVTCQTVLIYMGDPKAVIAEMVRVTRPGGLVLVVEPNN